MGKAERPCPARDRVRVLNEDRAVARAIDALRRGWPVAIDGLALLAIETADDIALAAFDHDAPADLLIAASRAATLKLVNQRPAASGAGAVQVARDRLDLTAARVLADPSIDLAHPLHGPYRSVPLAAPDSAAAALELARLAGLLPAFFVKHGSAEPAAGTAAVFAYEAADTLRLVTRARLPVAGAEAAEIVAFRGRDAAQEHVALLIGQPDGTAPLVRLHSECLTGDVLGSLKCDCGPQLDTALARIADSGWGVLLYLRQEGRAIGLVNKLRAYRLQDQGFDTVDANTRLGFAVDARNFGIAAQMLRLLGQERVRLLTNNPDKVTRLTEAGIAVVERVPLSLPPNPHNAAYLATKRDRTGHQL